jgi:hypothetical protein
MSNEAFADESIQKACKDHFGLSVEMGEVLVRGFSTSQTSEAAVFRTSTGQLFLYIVSRGAQLFGDVQKMVLRMGCEAEMYLPPNGEKEYFDRIAREKFKALFPGKPIVGEDDLRYYKGLAPYNPALIRLSKVKGEIRAYDNHLKAWRKVKDFNYSKIATI